MYKLTGISNLGQVNSGSTKAQAIFDEATLYPNPYMVVTPKGYTKHYYAGTERLATVIGQGGFKDVTYPTDKFLPYEKNIVASFYSRYLSTYDPFYYHGTLGNLVKTTDIHGDPNPDLQYQCKPTVLEFVDVLNQSDMLLKSISSNEHINNDEKEKFFYHGDYLGSASWITDYQGNPAQYIHYAPYGELIADQQIAGYDERYKFTGKERDRETGYDMFGARYLWSDAGIWTSVDPLAGDYPWITPYAYGLNNPLKYKDPNGKWV